MEKDRKSPTGKPCRKRQSERSIAKGSLFVFWIEAKNNVHVSVYPIIAYLSFHNANRSASVVDGKRL
jgi:hypothetical protein